jgi:hypothetical protein
MGAYACVACITGAVARKGSSPSGLALAYALISAVFILAASERPTAAEPPPELAARPERVSSVR